MVIILTDIQYAAVTISAAHPLFSGHEIHFIREFTAVDHYLICHVEQVWGLKTAGLVS